MSKKMKRCGGVWANASIRKVSESKPMFRILQSRIFRNQNQTVKFSFISQNQIDKINPENLWMANLPQV